MTNQINTVLEDVELANRLLRYGKREQDIEAIELAAKILQDSIYLIAQELPESDAAIETPTRKELETVPAAADARGVTARGAGGNTIGQNQWSAIQEGQTLTVDPHPTFAKKTKASVKITSDGSAKLFVYWRRVDLVEDPDDFAVGQGNVSAKWRTGIAKKRWEVQVENRTGPACKINVQTNAVG